MQQLVQTMGLLKKCGLRQGVPVGPGRIKFQVANESEWCFDVWDPFCNVLLKSFEGMKVRTVVGVAKDMAKLLKELESKPTCFFSHVVIRWTATISSGSAAASLWSPVHSFMHRSCHWQHARIRFCTSVQSWVRIYQQHGEFKLPLGNATVKDFNCLSEMHESLAESLHGALLC